MNLHQILNDPDHKYFIAYGVTDDREASIFIIKSTERDIEHDMADMRDLMYDVMALENTHTIRLTDGWIDTAANTIQGIRSDYGYQDEEDEEDEDGSSGY